MMMKHEQIDLVKLVAPVIEEAGALLISYYQKNIEWTEKGDGSFVTQADIDCERLLIKSLKPILIDASFIAEESGHHGDADYCWVIDPLDGTTNFAHHLPHFCISIALTFKDEPVFGMIYQPVLKELFYAQKGKGAWMNNQKIIPSRMPLEKSLIAMKLPNEKNERYASLLESSWQIARRAHAIRHLSAAALDLAYVASGKFSGIFFYGLRWWDVAAGLIILQEAGGMSSDFEGKKIGPGYKTFIGAGNQQVYEALIALLKPAHNI